MKLFILGWAAVAAAVVLDAAIARSVWMAAAAAALLVLVIACTGLVP